MNVMMLKILSLPLMLILACGLTASGQDDVGENVSGDEAYYKKNTALTEFSRLGVNAKQFAKCLRVVNYLDADRRLNVLKMGKLEFKDDGQGYDLVANDGILTSVDLAFYEPGEQVLPAGSYAYPKEEYLVHDPLFEHLSTAKVPLPRLRIACRTRWVPCSQMPHPINIICQEMGPPYGSLEFYDCHFELIIGF